MATPKEKAEELVEGYFPFLSDSIHSNLINEGRKTIAIKHSIITCEQVIHETGGLPLTKYTEQKIEYWQEVKNELQKM